MATAREVADANDGRSSSELIPLVDVIEDADGITLCADLPGVSRDTLHVHVEGDNLLLEGEMVLAMPAAMQSIHAEVRQTGYRRSFTLSRELDPGNVSAQIHNGVLRLRIPKAAHAKPRRIEIDVG